MIISCYPLSFGLPLSNFSRSTLIVLSLCPCLEKCTGVLGNSLSGLVNLTFYKTFLCPLFLNQRSTGCYDAVKFVKYTWVRLKITKKNDNHRCLPVSLRLAFQKDVIRNFDWSLLVIGLLKKFPPFANKNNSFMKTNKVKLFYSQAQLPFLSITFFHLSGRHNAIRIKYLCFWGEKVGQLDSHILFIINIFVCFPLFRDWKRWKSAALSHTR